jgi:hypothetical protein
MELATLNGVGGRYGKVNWYAKSNSRNPIINTIISHINITITPS